jgi:tetratricopeptide (TPR) repeat protein
MDRTKLLAYDPGWVRGAIPAGLVLSASTQPESDRAFLERQREIHRHRRLRTVEGPEGSRSLDFVSRQILRYYADDSFQNALWLESRGDLWNSMAFFDTGFQIDPDEPSAYSGVARVLGKAGYPEVSVDLCRKGLSLAPQEKVLQNNLLFSIHLAAMERSEGKTDRYEGLLREARTLHWGYLFRIFKGTADRLAAERGRTQHDGI